jgi:hypothetical protein
VLPVDENAFDEPPVDDELQLPAPLFEFPFVELPVDENAFDEPPVDDELQLPAPLFEFPFVELPVVDNPVDVSTLFEFPFVELPVDNPVDVSTLFEFPFDELPVDENAFDEPPVDDELQLAAPLFEAEPEEKDLLHVPAPFIEISFDELPENVRSLLSHLAKHL